MNFLILLALAAVAYSNPIFYDHSYTGIPTVYLDETSEVIGDDIDHFIENEEVDAIDRIFVHDGISLPYHIHYIHDAPIYEFSYISYGLPIDSSSFTPDYLRHTAEVAAAKEAHLDQLTKPLLDTKEAQTAKLAKTLQDTHKVVATKDVQTEKQAKPLQDTHEIVAAKEAQTAKLAKPLQDTHEVVVAKEAQTTKLAKSLQDTSKEPQTAEVEKTKV